MPAYNFKAKFADAVESGRKRQTIRKRRKRPTRPGDRLYLYTGMRTKACRKLRENDCLSVEPMVIDVGSVRLAGRRLTMVEVDQLSVADGFERADDFFEFFEQHYGLPFDEAELIKW